MQVPTSALTHIGNLTVFVMMILCTQTSVCDLASQFVKNVVITILDLANPFGNPARILVFIEDDPKGRVTPAVENIRLTNDLISRQKVRDKPHPAQEEFTRRK